jgi:POT family proton-dependent oligopeptide transporter
MPLFGAIVADQYWGRYRTIMSAIACALVGHDVGLETTSPYTHNNKTDREACSGSFLIFNNLGNGG